MGERTQLARQVHETLGHFGERRTLHLLASSYWWSGMRETVQQVIRACRHCDRARQAFNATTPELQPLPVMGLMYRWGVDLYGPLPRTKRGNSYVMICIEHFSKHVVAVPLPEKTAVQTRRALLERVIGVYGACAEVVTDNGTEFEGPFSALLSQCYIDHRRTSPRHPQADGLAERAVQTWKRAMRKLAQSQRSAEWDDMIPWISLGYACSPQESTRLSPYSILYGVSPVVPPAARERMNTPLNFDDLSGAEEQLLSRAEAMKRACAMAGGNLLIAQHRQTLRYAAVKGGGYSPQLRRFQPGDFVYLRRGSKRTSLELQARPEILQVLEVRPGGAVTLGGKCGRTIDTNVSNCAPCHLAGIDPKVEPTLARPDLSQPCERCKSPDNGAQMLLCDECGLGWHMGCLPKPLTRLPPAREVWICPYCERKGVDKARVQARVDAQPQPAPEPTDHALVPALSTARRDAEAAAYHKRRVEAIFYVRGKATRFQGTAMFKGAEHRPQYFRVKFDDGDERDYSLPGLQKIMISRERAAALAASTRSVSVLPPTWQLRTREGVAQALETLMPGIWGEEYVSRLVFEGRLPDRGIPSRAEAARLLNTLDMAAVDGVTDPWAGTLVIAKAVWASGKAVCTNYWDREAETDTHEDALQPSFFERLANRWDLDAIITCPNPCWLDIALPLAARAAHLVACVLVPGNYVTDAPSPRKAWFRQLQETGRLHLMLGMPKGDLARSQVWVIVFKCSQLRQIMLPAAELASAIVL